MIIKWKMKSGNFSNMVEIYYYISEEKIIFDKTYDKIFEKYLKNIFYVSYNNLVISHRFCFVSEEKFSAIKHKINTFIFTFEFPDEETAFYYSLKYGIESNV